MEMEIPFVKYQGAGNDFVILEQRDLLSVLNADFTIEKLVQQICSLHYGVAADGLFVILGTEEGVWHVDFYNRDGSKATMCGNGSRCVSAYLFSRMKTPEHLILAIGDIEIVCYYITEHKIGISMPVEDGVEWLPREGGYLINTGVPHLVMYVDSLQELLDLDLVSVARPLRNSVCGSFGGVNVDFYTYHEGKLVMRTYERGVEGETRACGTGAVAVALIGSSIKNLPSPQKVHVLGGVLEVDFEIERTEEEEVVYRNVYLTGDAYCVARGMYYC